MQVVRAARCATTAWIAETSTTPPDVAAAASVALSTPGWTVRLASSNHS